MSSSQAIDSNIQHYSSPSSLIGALTRYAKSGKYVFRGYSKQLELLPKIIRGADLSRYESSLMTEFERFGSHYFVASSPIDFLSYGQHYGLPTRLLDFTYNPFIALSFALFEEKRTPFSSKEDKEYYYIRLCEFQENILLNGLPANHNLQFRGFERSSLARSCFEYIQDFDKYLKVPNYKDFHEPDFERNRDSYFTGLCECYIGPQLSNGEDLKNDILRKVSERKLCFVDPNMSNQRIIMQQGLFLLPYTLFPNEHETIFRQNTRTMAINKSFRKELLEYLSTLGYNTFRLMPDLTNVCAVITQKYLEKQ